MKNANPALRPNQLRQLLIKTVDFKPWLQKKVLAGGVVNAKRAVFAAKLAKGMSLTEAIAQSRGVVKDEPVMPLPRTFDKNAANPTLDRLADGFVF